MTINHKIIKNFFVVAMGLIILTSCEDVVNVNLDEGANELVVDAWLDNTENTQTVRLTRSQPYFNASFAEGITDATVTVERNDGTTFQFAQTGQGNYQWTPTTADEIGTPGNEYTLTIERQGEVYTSTTEMYDVAIVDSIGQEFRDDELGGPDGIYCEFFARDITGIGNTYWIKTFKNDEFLNKPSELNFSYDGTFGPGSGIDGLTFITPIREAVNRDPDDEDSVDNSDVPPWDTGDKIRVEIHSISNFTFDFLTIAFEQMTNSDNGIFAIPLANTKGNVINQSTGKAALGIFNVAAVSSDEAIIE